MGIFDSIRKQFIDVIEWTEDSNGILAFKYPMEDNEIQNGAQLTVRESQVAVFVDEGRLADAFNPGRYRLTTQTLPVLTALKNWDKLFESPFKSDVFYFSTREQLDQRWGTSTPIVFQDQQMGPIRMRANGSFSYRISDPRIFFSKVSGTRETYSAGELLPQLRALVITHIASTLAASQVPFVQMAANQLKFSEALSAALKPAFESYGLQLQTFFVQSLSLPEELQTFFDKAASMNMLGDLGRYAQFQSAEAMTLAAKNEGGGGAGAGVGIGAGIALGQQLAQNLSGAGSSGGTSSSAASSGIALQLIEQLHQLMSKGVITQAEFDSKKAELLKQIK